MWEGEKPPVTPPGLQSAETRRAEPEEHIHPFWMCWNTWPSSGVFDLSSPSLTSNGRINARNLRSPLPPVTVCYAFISRYRTFKVRKEYKKFREIEGEQYKYICVHAKYTWMVPRSLLFPHIPMLCSSHAVFGQFFVLPMRANMFRLLLQKSPRHTQIIIILKLFFRFPNSDDVSHFYTADTVDVSPPKDPMTPPPPQLKWVLFIY